MGIKGLLPQLKSITSDASINMYEGRRVGIDGYVWLHQKSYSCATQLCLGQPTDEYVKSFIKEITVLLHNKVVPVVVFDGTYLPLKAKEEAERAESRKANLKAGKKLYRAGRKDEAYAKFTKAVNITPQMAFEVICRLKQINVEYVVAPYEADAQLAYLYRTKYIAAVISIDSDLLPFGCERLLTKYKDGWCKEIDLTKLKHNVHPLNFKSFTFEMFMQFCIFCGCDYLSNIQGVGPKTAHQYMRLYKRWNKALQKLRFDGKHKVPRDYEHQYRQALYTFRHQRVYDPGTKRLVHLQPLPPDVNIGPNTDFLGPDMDPNIAQQIAEGVIDPITKDTLHPQTLSLALRQHQALLSRSLSPKAMRRGRTKSKSKAKAKASQSNTMMHYLDRNKNRHEKHSSSISVVTQCESPPPPHALFAKQFEELQQQIAIANTLQTGNDHMEQKQVSDHDQEDEHKRPHQPTVNAIASYQRLDSFAFNSQNTNTNRSRAKNGRNRTNARNKRDEAIVIEDDDNQHERHRTDEDVVELSQTQQADQISNRHKRKRTASTAPAQVYATQTTYHKFKKVVPKKGIPVRPNRKRSDQQSSSSSSSNNSSNDNLDDKMAQFAYQNQSANNNPTANSRKRRRSPEQSNRHLLPSRPTSSVDYNNKHEDDAGNADSAERYEDKPHQFRVPRVRSKFNNERTKKRRLSSTEYSRHRFESPFIPKQAGTLAVCYNNNTIPQGSLSSFAFKQRKIDRNRNNHNKQQHQSSSAVAPASTAYNVNNVETALPDGVLEDSNTTQYELTGDLQHEQNEQHQKEELSPDEIRNDENANLQGIDEDDDDVIDEEFLQRYPRGMSNTTIAMGSYIPETPEPPDPETTDVSIGHDDDEEDGGIQYVPSSLEMTESNNNVDLQSSDLMEIPAEINEPCELDQGPSADFDSVDVGLHDFSVPLQENHNIDAMSLIDDELPSPDNDKAEQVDLLDDTQQDDDDDVLLLDDAILAIDNRLRVNGFQADRNQNDKADGFEGSECIDLTLDDVEDNQERHRQAKTKHRELILINDDDMFPVDDNEAEELNPDDFPNLYEQHEKRHGSRKHKTIETILLSDDDKENVHVAVEKQQVNLRKSPSGWKRKMSKSTSPDVFDDAQTFNSDILNVEEQELENEIDAEVEMELLSQNGNGLDVDADDVALDDDDLFFNEEMNDLPFTEEDDLNIDTLPIDVVLRNPVSSADASPKRRTKKNGFNHRRKRQLALLPVRDSCALTQDDYFRFPSGSTSTEFFPYNTEILEIRACENTAGLTYFGLYEEEDGNDNLQGFGYETSSGQVTIYRMDILPLSNGTFTASVTENSDSSLTFTFSDASHDASLITATSPDNYECVLPYEGTEAPLTIVGLSATGPGAGDEGPPENVAVTSASEACYFYEPDSDDMTQWHPGTVDSGILIANNIHIGEYQQSTSLEAYGINMIMRYERTMFIESFCRVSPRDSLSHVANHTVFCKTFSGLVLDEEPYRTCPLCTLSGTTVTECQQNEIVTTTAEPSGARGYFCAHANVFMFVFTVITMFCFA